MSRAWKVALLLALVLLFGMVVSLAWGAPQKADEPKMPVFSVKDHKLIEDYYNHLVGTLAPGSLDRSGFPPGIENRSYRQSPAIMPGTRLTGTSCWCARMI